MSPEFSNVYEDERRAESYAELGFPGTYYLAYRDIPEIIQRHVDGRRALDFGCGTGRSTRFLRELGFDVIGVDISESMLERARELNPDGDYRLVPDGALPGLEPASFDLVLSVFTFDNIPALEHKLTLFRALGGLLARNGRIVNLVSAPEIYLHEWASFSTRDFPENRDAVSGQEVRIVMLDVDDDRPVTDILCSGDDYLTVYEHAGLIPEATYRPLGRQEDPFDWVSEMTISPWAIYVLGDAGNPDSLEN
ncbi:MAG: class I SAM-dependent methyltransferase [Gemmatimonadetes bacterium]|nr:class I SAM-dependent methyltransferase [Gemmatimonadota bacterium]